MNGWLTVVGLLIVLIQLRAALEILDFWETAEHGGMSAWVIVGVRAVTLVWGVLLVGLMIGRSRYFPPSFIAFALFDIVCLTLLGLAFVHLTANEALTGVAVGVSLNLLAIAYVGRSRRVSVTFLRRVRTGKKRHRLAGNDIAAKS